VVAVISPANPDRTAAMMTARNPREVLVFSSLEEEDICVKTTPSVRISKDPHLRQR
jgi:hypothetical protein